MISSDVPTASLIFVNNNNAGTIKKPPPAATKPVIIPTIKPSIIIHK